MFAYSKDNTPAPIARVNIRSAATNRSVDNVVMLLDTGADTTLIPRIILPALGIAEESLKRADYFLVGFDGTRTPAYLVSLEITFLNKVLSDDYSLTDANYGIIGRDVLNQFHLVFDGPRRTWEEAKLP